MADARDHRALRITGLTSLQIAQASRPRSNPAGSRQLIGPVIGVLVP